MFPVPSRSKTPEHAIENKSFIKTKKKKRDCHDNRSQRCLFVALTVLSFFAKKQIANEDHPPYSPDFAHCHFRLFPRMRTAIKARIQSHMDRVLKSIPEDDFQKFFELTSCTAAHFKEDNSKK